jgi:hypothetical protein
VRHICSSKPNGGASSVRSGNLALPAEEFIWLRNAGNIIASTLSSTMRSLALVCAVKGGRAIAIIGVAGKSCPANFDSTATIAGSNAAALENFRQDARPATNQTATDVSEIIRNLEMVGRHGRAGNPPSASAKTACNVLASPCFAAASRR